MDVKAPKGSHQGKKSKNRTEEKFARKFPYRPQTLSCEAQCGRCTWQSGPYVFLADGDQRGAPAALGGHEDEQLAAEAAAPAEDVGAHEVRPGQRVSLRPDVTGAACGPRHPAFHLVHT
ncbi:uncharacterized protein C3orf22 homolog isoform X2 [Orcinus orca]|uniref:uncharacterized protein C3orf22 homolog isoform X2 n=1 Tax=Orcinus orca TaxID=9733 RepID=UPI00211191DD|nr:uncharacterized protein C3orf22 homolog isoform X2 [Orcinus orca]